MGTILGKQRYNEEPVELMRETKYFSQWTLADVRELYARFRKTWGFAITESQLESLILLKQPDAVSIKEIFTILDATRDGKQDGRIDGLEFIGGLTVICQDTFEEKARFAFEVFDFNLNGSLSPIELALLMRSCYGGITILTGGHLASVPPIPVFVQVAQQAFTRFDKDHTNALNYEEFIAWARSNREFMLYMDTFRTISETAKERVPEAEWIQEASDDDSDIEVECRVPPPRVGPSTALPSFQLEPWMVEPLDPKPAPRRLPPTNISLEWVYGYRGYDARNNVRYTSQGDIVYSVSRHAIVYNTTRHEQRYYEGHRNEILSLAVPATGDKVATGDVGPDCAIHVWSPSTLECLVILRQFHDDGIALLAFANRYDSQLVSVGLDVNHRIAIWDWQAKTVIASGIGSTNKALAVAMHDNGHEVVVAGHKSLEFFTVEHRILKKERAALGTTGMWQGFLSVVYFQSYVVVGTSLGQLYQFQNRRLVRTTQAHPLKESVNCLFVARASLFSGGKDGMVHQWDSTLQTIGHPMDLSTLALPLSDFRISSLCYNFNDDTGEGTLLVGTRSCKILQVNEVSRAVTLVTAFHQQEPCSGLATTPKRAEFATCGLDRIVRRWSLRKREQLSMLPLFMYPPGQCLTYSTSGDYIAMGCADGTVVIVDHGCTKALSTFRHARVAVVAIRFAASDQLLAVSCANGLIYVYRVEHTTPTTFRLCQQYLLQPLATEAAVPGTSLDFSVDTRYLQSQHGAALRFWDLRSAGRVSVAQHVRDVVWSSFSSAIGYSVQQLHATHDTVSASAVSRHQTLLGTVTTDGYIALRAYPALDNLSKRVLGHGPHAKAFVGFARNDGLLITATTDDHCICQWKLTKEMADEQPRPKHVVSATADPCADAHLLQWSPAATNRPNPAMATLLTPSYYTPNPQHKAEAPDLDLELDYAHGMNWSNGRAMLGATESGAVVYSAATIGIVFDPSTRTQKRYIYHKQRITCLAVHSSGKFVVTGSMNQLVVWDAATLETYGVVTVSAPVLFAVFNSTDMLVAVLADRYHSVVAYLWKEMHLIDQAENTLERVMDLTFTLDGTSVVTCGVNHMRFWTIENRSHLASQQGIFGRVALRQTLLSAATAGGQYTATGCVDGSLILWENSHAAFVLSAHAAPVTSAVFSTATQQLVTAASDGSLLVWQAVAKATTTTSLALCGRWGATTAIVGLTMKDARLFVVTDESTLLELPPTSIEWLVTAASASAPASLATSSTPAPSSLSGSPSVLLAWHGHAIGAVRGLACHPTLQIIATAGDDKTLRVWDLHTHLQLQLTTFASAPTALAYSPVPLADDKFHLAVALAAGSVVIVDAASLESLTTVALGRHQCRDVKYAPTGAVLACACHDAKIYLITVKDRQSYTLAVVCETTLPARSPVTHVDFNVDATILRSNTMALECTFWDVATGALLAHSVAARETHWNSCTCPSNWALVGAAQDVPLACADRVQPETSTGAFTSLVPVVAVGDMRGRVRLLWYPCVERSAAKTYFGHASPLHTLRFTAQNAFLVSLGSFDRTLLVWRTDFAEELKARRAAAATGEIVDAPTHAAIVSDELLLSVAYDAKREASGDEFLAVKPWLGAIREPSGWTAKPEDGAAPAGQLDLAFVHGYRGFDTRNNLRYGADASTCIYHTAAVGIVYSKAHHRQIFHFGHTDDIVCLAVHPEGHLVATGETGKTPKLILWDANSGSSLCTIVGFHRRGVALVAFTSTGEHIVSHGMDDDHSLAIYSLQGKLIASCSSSKQRILDLDVLATDGLSVGEKTVLFWSLSQTTLSIKKGSFGKGDPRATVLCGLFVAGEAVTGQGDGSLYRWKGRSCTAVVPKCHAGAVNCLGHDAKAKWVLSGGRDGVVRVWSYTLEALLAFDLKAAAPKLVNASLRSLSVKSGKLLLGTQGCEICEVDLADVRTKKDAPVSTFIVGHAGGELWGLAPHPQKQQFVTAGDDGTVRLWDGPNRVLLESRRMPKKCRTVAMSPDGTHIAVGTNDGSVVVLKEALDDKDECVVVDLRVSLRAISVLRYSPDGKTLVVGSHDQRIYLFTAPAYTKRCVCKGHSSYITAVDFSADSQFLQSNCGAYELLFWQADKGKQVTSANALRDVKWATWTCTLGWPVQGIWPKGGDGTDVNAAARTTSQKELLTVDDHGQVNLFRYPCVAPHATAKTYRGHSSHVTNCIFTKGDMFAVSTGGLDNAIFQFKYVEK
ncbi:microtubule-associated protein [Achlya hypogyna]|uniref:Microtubule-associated protein n=1 Tax=Achlya hypogyna TaxID=1202772 RepID=A0A1V9YC52_ACHHY|nr:microtubule-associated protein [Achlya hypogyna]